MSPTKHFSADDLDAFHSEALSNEMRLHLETCDQCRRLVAEDRQLLALLSELPSFEARADLEDRVMARVAIAGPERIPLLSFPTIRGRRLGAVMALAAGLVASVAWSAANRALLEQWLDRSTAYLYSMGTAWMRTVELKVTTQPWFGRLAETVESPLRLAVALVLGLSVYSLGIIALRRLITPSVEGVSNANA